MNPLRILILSTLFYILYRLIFGQLKKAQPFYRQNSDREAQDNRDLLVEDPVCHVYVPQRQAAVTCKKDGQTFYFCSDKCYKEFLSGNYNKQ